MRNGRLFQDGSQRPFGYVAGVIGNGDEATSCWINPDFVGTRCLPMELKSQCLQPLDDLPVLEPGQASHYPLTTSG